MKTKRRSSGLGNSFWEQGRKWEGAKPTLTRQTRPSGNLRQDFQATGIAVTQFKLKNWNSPFKDSTKLLKKTKAISRTRNQVSKATKRISKKRQRKCQQWKLESGQLKLKKAILISRRKNLKNKTHLSLISKANYNFWLPNWGKTLRQQGRKIKAEKLTNRKQS